MPHFEHLRDTPWAPTFTWAGTAAKAADQINVWHEDYPQRVVDTEDQITTRHWPINPIIISNALLQFIHNQIFTDTTFAGKWRDVNVTVGQHKPPHWDLVAENMEDFASEYLFMDSMGMLQDWYYDFETIHPFQDGNGRVGGVIVAAASHKLHPDKGWLAPNQ